MSPLYRGQSWENEMIRADLDEAIRRREVEQKEEHRRSVRRQAARQPIPPVKPTPPTPPPTPEPTPARRTWHDLSPDELHRF